MEKEITFAQLGIPQEILLALEDKGYGYPTRVQELAIPPMMEGKDILAKRSAINGDEMDDDEISIENLIGWAILGKRGEKIGEITDFEPIPGNPCLYVKHGEETVMIPLHDDLIIDIDEDAKTLSLDLPEGLF